MKSLLLILSLMCPIVSSASPSTIKLSFDDTRHLLARTGFGANPSELNALLGMSRQAAVEKIVEELNTDSDANLPAWTTKDSPQHWRFQELSDTDKQKFRVARGNEIQSLRLWWVQKMISTTSPQSERLLLFWHNHFTTGFSSINNHSLAIARQHNMLRKHGSGNFRNLLKQIIRDPAMLNYLDNNNSRKAKPNENFARELMELFALGEGNFTEQDVKNAARALTGYSDISVYDQRFVFKHWIHDKSNKEIFGQTGRFDGDDLVDLILEQPAAAQFIAAKLWRVLVGDIQTADEKLTTHANVFRQSDYDIKTLYKSILLSEDFWRKNNRANLVQSPVALTIGTIRSTGHLPGDWQTLPSTLTQMGQQLFDPPNVAGWPGGGSWITPGRLLTRIEWLRSFAEEAANGSQQNSNEPLAGTTNMMMGSQTTSSAAMTSNSNNMMASPSMQDTADGLKVRLASEEFDGPAKYSVTLFGKNEVLWESGEQVLTGGHDTERMGRINRRSMPWQTISFPVSISADNIESIEVAFLNDKSAPPDADRNLFVSHVTLGNSAWLAQNGKQDTSCNRKKAAQQGNLYCNGKLRMDIATTIDDATPTDIARNTLRASGVYLHSAKAPTKKGGDLIYTLSDVEFAGRYWKSLTVRYLLDKKGEYSIRINDFDCWPECVTQWPECSWKNEYGNSILAFPINPANPKQQCMYDELLEVDRNLVSALWSAAEDFYHAASGTVKLRRNKNVSARYDQWKPHVDNIQQLLQTSPYVKAPITLEILQRPINDFTINEAVTLPVSGGITTTKRQQALDQLLIQNEALNLYTLLLPSTPLNTEISTDPTLSDVITDLAYQLH